MVHQNKLHQIKKLIETADASLQAAKMLLAELVGSKDVAQQGVLEKVQEVGSEASAGEQKVIEGVFDGQQMIGPDSKKYSVPANYASKSKLVEGDTLKLTIAPDGSFIYKQIGPVERARLVGGLSKDEVTDEYRVLAGNRVYKVLLASVTYFKGVPGDEVVILVPKNGESTWAAVENIIKQGLGGTQPDVGLVTPQAASQGDIDDLE